MDAYGSPTRLPTPLPQTKAEQAIRVGCDLLPQSGEDVAVDHTPQHFAGGGHQNILQVVHDLILRIRAVALAGGNDFGQRLQFRVVDCHILDIIQHAVGPQVAGDIVQDQAVDLALLIQRIVADVQKIQVCPR